MGCARNLGVPCVNWEWLIFPSLSILSWIFILVYARIRVTKMPAASRVVMAVGSDRRPDRRPGIPPNALIR
jgi:hypothetical protein